MKKELIDKLFVEINKDEDIIKKNLMQVMDIIRLEAKDDYGKLTLTIKYERIDEDETKNN